MKNKPFSARDLSFCAIYLTVLIICSWLSIPTIVPFTMQIFALFLLCYNLKFSCSLITIFSYLLLGIIGVPVFSGFNSGIGVLLSPTGGFLIGFFAICIFLRITKSLQNSILSKFFFSLVGLILCYFIGVVWAVLIYFNDVSKFIYVLSTFIFPFVIFDCLKIFCAIILTEKFKKVVK